MRTIGLIGGMSWESSAEYYRVVNRGVRDRLGPAASARPGPLYDTATLHAEAAVAMAPEPNAFRSC